MVFKNKSRAKARKVTRKSLAMPKHSSLFVRGHRINIANHPTEFDAVPWWPLIVRVVDPPATLTLGNLFTSLVTQTNVLNTGALVNIRLMNIRVWGPIPPTNARLTVTFRDVFDTISGSSPVGSQMILEEVSDYADAVNRARVGYVYSSAQQNKSLFLTTALPDEICSLSGAGPGSVLYVQLLWRPFHTAPPPAVTSVDNSDTESDSEVEVIKPLRKRTGKLSVC